MHAYKQQNSKETNPKTQPKLQPRNKKLKKTHRAAVAILYQTRPRHKKNSNKTRSKLRKNSRQTLIKLLQLTLSTTIKMRHRKIIQRFCQFLFLEPYIAGWWPARTATAIWSHHHVKSTRSSHASFNPSVLKNWWSQIRCFLFTIAIRSSILAHLGIEINLSSSLSIFNATSIRFFVVSISMA